MNIEEKLKKASVVCQDCGEKYGKYIAGCSSVWTGKCDVCGKKKFITEVRDYNDLRKDRPRILC